MSSPTAPAARRNPALVVVDIVVSVALFIFSLVFGLYSVAFVVQLNEVAGSCGAGCNTGLLTAVAYGLLAVTVLGFFLGFGFAVVRVIRKRYTWPWAIATLVVLIVAFYLAAFLGGQAVAGVSQ